MPPALQRQQPYSFWFLWRLERRRKAFCRFLNGILMVSTKRTRTLASVHACQISGALMLIPLALAAPGHAQLGQENHTRVLSKVSEVRALTASQAKQLYPIHLKGVITYRSPEYLVTFFQDQTAGIFLWIQQGDAGVSAGDLVEVDGKRRRATLHLRLNTRGFKSLDVRACPHLSQRALRT